MISPLLQSHMLEFANDLPFERGIQLLNTALPHAEASATQSQRLAQYYGNSDAVEQAIVSPGFDFAASVLDEKSQQTSSKVLYVEVDGGHLRTDEGYRETKVGRIFGAQHRFKQSSDYEGVALRMALEQSDYLAQLGSCETFIPRFNKLIDNHLLQTPDAQMVVISDGAAWIGKWFCEQYPKAVVILDFYHAKEHLAEFAKAAFIDTKVCSEWIEERSKELLEGQIDKVIAAIETQSKALSNLKTKEMADTLVAYYEKNKYRMKYKEYRDKGYCIGSGAIESAISTVVQQRCKLVGQRWTERVTPVLNIRTVFKSGKRKKLREIISKKMGLKIAA